MKRHSLLYVAITCLLALHACGPRAEKHNELSSKEKEGGWQLLFDGTSTTGWHVYNQGPIASAWSADSGMLVCNPRAKNVKHGDLVTDKTYENFDLTFEWKISKGGNSGVFINVQEKPEFGTTWATGPEYQLLDDKNKEPEYLENKSHKAAAIFGVIPNKGSVAPKSGQWNQSRILQQNGKVTFWLNGEQTVQVDMNSDEWKKMIADSPMSRHDSYGTTVKGELSLQDWTNGVAFRDIKIKEL
jgi:Domain of Unknown Function (DUF1080)